MRRLLVAMAMVGLGGTAAVAQPAPKPAVAPPASMPAAAAQPGPGAAAQIVQQVVLPELPPPDITPPSARTMSLLVDSGLL